MDEARKLLDSLMGHTRDSSLEEAKKNKGQNFTQDNVCKFFLLGFCPQYELSNSKLTTKRNLGECNKVHSDAMKAEYDAHPEKAKFQAEYERMFLPFLEGQVREADAWVARERANAQKTEANLRDKTTISTMPQSVKDQIAALEEDMNKMMASAEELAEKGDIEGSKFKVVLAEEIKGKIKELEEKHPSYTVTLKEEWVCDICGTRTEAVTEANETRFAAHFQGKVHLGYAKIREWVKELRKKQRDGEETRRGSRDDRRGGDEQRAGRRRSRSKGEAPREPRGGRRERRRSRSREERPPEEPEPRRRSRSRRGGSRERERRRNRSRSREERRRRP